MYKMLLLLLAVCFLFGCSNKAANEVQTQPPPTPKISYYVNETVRYKVPISKDWTIKSSPNADLFVVRNDGTFTPEPSVNIVTVKADTYDLWDKKSQAKLKAQLDKRLKSASEANVTIGGQRGFNLVYGMEKDGVSVIFNQTYVFHNGYFIVITASSREEEYNRFESIFKDFVKSVEFF